MLSLIFTLIISIFFYLIFPYYQVIIKKKQYGEQEFNKMNFVNSIIITIICLIIIHTFKMSFICFSFLPISSFLFNDLILKKYIDINHDRKTKKSKNIFIVLLNIISLFIYIFMCVSKYLCNKGVLNNSLEILNYFISIFSWIGLFLLIIEYLVIFLFLKRLLNRINKKNFIAYLLLSTFIFFVLYALTVFDFRIFAVSSFGYGYEALVFKYLLDLIYIYYIVIVFVNLLLLFQNKKVLIYIISLIIFIFISNITSFHFDNDIYTVYPICNGNYDCSKNGAFSKGNVYFDYFSDDTEETIDSYSFYYNLPFINSIIWIKDKKIKIYNIDFYEDKFVVSSFDERYSFERSEEDDDDEEYKIDDDYEDYDYNYDYINP